jgi:hypothetical protein
LKTLVKPGVVLAGYVAAFLVADAALYLRELQMPAEAKTSVGVYAFGDLILFVEVLGVSARRTSDPMGTIGRDPRSIRKRS